MQWLATFFALLALSLMLRHGLAWFRHSENRVPGVSEAGQGLVEYGLTIVFVGIVAVGIVSVLGSQIDTTFDRIQCEFSGGEWHADEGNNNSSRCR